MKVLSIVASVGVAEAAGGGLFNMTDAEWKENKAVFDRNLEDYEQGNYVSTANVQSRMTKCEQICSNWCWAASSTMAASHFASISSSQCSTYEAKAASLVFGKTCGTNCRPSGCDEGGYSSDMVKAISSLSGGTSYTIGHSLSPDQLNSALSNGPVIFHIKWKSGGGHAITCSGVSNNQYTIHDPEHQQDIIESYSGIMHYSHGGTGTWVESIYKRGTSPSGCRANPTNWQSSEGESCSYYESHNYCTSSGGEGSGWKSSWGPISKYADSQGRSATDACCGCGGGSRGFVV